MFWKRINVSDSERALVTKDGGFGGILSPGTYVLSVPLGVSLEVEKHNVFDLLFRSEWADYLIRERPHVVRRHFTRIQTNEREVALVYADGMLYNVLPPAKQVLFWRGVCDVTAEVVQVIAHPEIPVHRLPAFERMGRDDLTFQIAGQRGRTGLPLAARQHPWPKPVFPNHEFCRNQRNEPTASSFRNRTHTTAEAVCLLNIDTRTNSQAAA